MLILYFINCSGGDKCIKIALRYISFGKHLDLLHDKFTFPERVVSNDT